MRISDWSSDVCSSDLPAEFGEQPLGERLGVAPRHREHQQIFDQFMVEQRIAAARDQALAQAAAMACMVGRGNAHARQGLRMTHDVRSEEHTSELQSLMRISYAVFCLKKTNQTIHNQARNHITQYNK